MAYLFDTDAISEVLRPRPAPRFLDWLSGIERHLQFTSAVCIGELYKGAFRSEHRERHLRNLDERVLPTLTVLPFDVPSARRYGEVLASLERTGLSLADADVQIAATAIEHGLELVTGNLRHFRRIPDLRIHPILEDSRRR